MSAGRLAELVCNAVFDRRDDEVDSRQTEVYEWARRVVATAFGNTYGMSETEQLEAMRQCAGELRAALGECDPKPGDESLVPCECNEQWAHVDVTNSRLPVFCRKCSDTGVRQNCERNPKP